MKVTSLIVLRIIGIEKVNQLKRSFSSRIPMIIVVEKESMGLGGSKAQQPVAGRPPQLTSSQRRTLAAANQVMRDLQGRPGGSPLPSRAFPILEPPGINALPPPMPYNIPQQQSNPPIPYNLPQVSPSRPSYGNTPFHGQTLLPSHSYGHAQPHQDHHHRPHAGGYRDTDFAAVANIAGLNPADIALLHREYTHLTRGGTSKIDRVVFRQLLRETLIEINNENIDRAIENIFIAIDRNRDGFIDFPEFVGAFRDVLKGGPMDSQNLVAQFASQKYVNDQLQANVIPQSQSVGQLISYPSTVCQQPPIIYESANPMVMSMDCNQSPYVYQSYDQTPGLSYLSPTY